MNKSIMLQGTASTVGKSILCTALCRIFTEDGYDVYPFKAQNMSLNSGVTPEGDEIGRAQIMQAEGAYKIPNAKMNPILLKPTSDRKSQVVLLGKPWDNLDAVDYFERKKVLKKEVIKVYEEISKEHELIVIEGAGSPAEINLSDEFVNMGMAKIANSPVLLVGDIDKGGVFASIYGTVMLLPEDERKLIKGIIINKFRGSIELLEHGLKQIEELTGIPVVGVIPYFKLDLEDEDSVTDFNKFKRSGELNVGVIKLPYMSNFTDFNSLALSPNVELSFVSLQEDLDKYHLIVIPGSKSTIADLKALKDSGMDKKIIEQREKGKFIFGICGGYQILGREIYDLMGYETSLEKEEGLALLNIKTEFYKDKNTVISKGVENMFDSEVEGYEIHMGKSQTTEKAFIKLSNGEVDGALSKDSKVIGTYFHGIFDNEEFTLRYLNKVRLSFNIAEEKDSFNYRKYKNEQYDKLASIVRESLDMKKIYSILDEGTKCQ